MIRRIAGRLRPTHTGDEGLTLVELVVSMTIMAIFMMIFTGGIMQMYRAANKTESNTVAQSQVNVAFLRLDKEIRYASGVSLPGTFGSDPYVEYVNTSTGTGVCTGLRLDAGRLQKRTWNQGSTPSSSLWVTLATNLTATTPFTFKAADDTANFQRLELDLLSTSGSGSTASTRETDITFTALNTSLKTSSDTVCSEGRSA